MMWILILFLTAGLLSLTNWMFSVCDSSDIRPFDSAVWFRSVQSLWSVCSVCCQEMRGER